MKKSILLLIVVLLLSGCGGTPTKIPPTATFTPTPTRIPPTIVPDGSGCKVTAPPKNTYNVFYSKYCSVGGIAILSSGQVPDEALQQAWYIVTNMSAEKPEVLKTLADAGVIIGIIGKDEVVTDMPEYAQLGSSWNWARGLGATSFIPLSSGAEENLLCYDVDAYNGENIFVHEFSHTFVEMGIDSIDPDFVLKVKDAYKNAISKGLWLNTYADDTWNEYWAEGVQSYFNSNLEGFSPAASATPIPTVIGSSTPAPMTVTPYPDGNGIHNFVNTRDELKQYDPTLYDLIAEVFPAFDWTPKCPERATTATFTPSPPAMGGVSAGVADASGSMDVSGGEGVGFSAMSGVVQADRLACRYGPGAPYLFQYGLIKGNEVQVYGRNQDNTWVYIGFGPNINCWVNAKFLQKGDTSSLEVFYPEKAPLILFQHPSFPPPSNVQAARSANRVVITWVGYDLALGDRESADSPRYLVETWTCQEGKIVFTANGAFEEVIAVTDETNCAEPSHGQVYIAHKDGYIGPVQIPWPK